MRRGPKPSSVSQLKAGCCGGPLNHLLLQRRVRGVGGNVEITCEILGPTDVDTLRAMLAVFGRAFEDSDNTESDLNPVGGMGRDSCVTEAVRFNRSVLS